MLAGNNNFSFYNDNEVCSYNGSNDSIHQNNYIICSFPARDTGGYAVSFSSTELNSNINMHSDALNYYSPSLDNRSPRFNGEFSFSPDTEIRIKNDNEFVPSLHRAKLQGYRKVKFI
ncbi:hypothetical protein TVAG_081090 [Trichomonas vaginalis G3]|uniref:Uncharacterized protein n=1 Tax=Trichomonas vaginalis (strain ATCC PRA-98 / G3) TaxID=412133 RepID=A2EPD2_TRIV3|nr:hypothetical protein TVAGG3_0679890 [Trichomonas vaginalis G3]EAY05517.1 hypothetical protein TVAG_081090 [Trichomonas vaginalis G3]KAI5507829.1 hypothetical protein TVAGG3_0679890 [Trichomonas vaginalis G3]|eukprot:XP_001317740.1 hypothetical protein [Trichomonas vaginalis G3]